MELSLQFLTAPEDVVTLQAASAGGDWFSNRNGRSRAHVRNVGGVTKRVIVTRQRPDSDGELQDWSVDIPPTAMAGVVFLEDINAYAYNEPGTGFVHLSYPDGEAGLEVGAEGRT